MVRAPCCEKMGMKRGPWTAEEDQVLINFISFYGHGNWRALPKQAGLLRCGKSCRLRWNNYLRPDIKRGNFTKEEEYTIVNLHQLLGNRWSAIAARLPGRTDNEIKNVWHTHLKKRLVNKEQEISSSDTISVADDKPQPLTSTSTTTSRDRYSAITCHRLPPPCPQPSSSTGDISSSVSNNENNLVGSSINNNEFLEIDENFWSEAALSVRNKPSCTVSAFPLSSFFSDGNMQGEPSTGLMHGGDHNGMEFWYEMFNGTGESLLFEG